MNDAKGAPTLIMNAEGLKKIKSGNLPPLFEKSVDQAKQIVDQAIADGIDVPIPKDMGGGYTHEQHKANYRHMNLAGALYQITGKEKYADYIKTMLLEYAEMYPSLPIHPTNRSYATGKLFWQCLNDANWLVYTSQAYDAIYDYLSEEERSNIETNILRPYADFISLENPKFFNRIHNHSTWGNAGVGMMGFAMRDSALVQRALYGLDLKDKDLLEKDNDGGFIYEQGEAKAGFLAQIDHAFSPDGYYTEGPYYQRYAMSPFMIFAQALHNNRPDLKIFEYRNGLLLKATSALVSQTNAAGQFFPINDAVKGMSISSASVLWAVNVAFGANGDDNLLPVAAIQDQVLLDQNGYALAKRLADAGRPEWNKSPVQLRDGAKGDEGAIGILRSGADEKEVSLCFKYTAQGLGHGHYDKLSFLLNDGADDVLQDYGAARWVNIDQKAGGRYLPENNTFAKQTIAHNALIMDQTSHFGGVYKIANANHSSAYYFDVSDPDFQIASAIDTFAYADVNMHRTMIMWKYDDAQKPLVLDIMSANGTGSHQFDLPYQFGDHLMQTSFDYQTTNSPKVLGNGHGYQHVWKEADAVLADNQYQFNWFKNEKFYTVTGIADKGDQMILGRIGANDPNFNLRRDAMLIHRKTSAANPVYISAIELHGTYSPVSEIPINPYSNIESITKLLHNTAYTVFEIGFKNGKTATIGLSNQNADKNKLHNVQVGKDSYSWSGPFTLIEK